MGVVHFWGAQKQGGQLGFQNFIGQRTRICLRYPLMRVSFRKESPEIDFIYLFIYLFVCLFVLVGG